MNQKLALKISEINNRVKWRQNTWNTLDIKEAQRILCASLISKICPFKWRKLGGWNFFSNARWRMTENYHLKICSWKMFFSIISYVMDLLFHHWKKNRTKHGLNPESLLLSLLTKNETEMWAQDFLGCIFAQSPELGHQQTSITFCCLRNYSLLSTHWSKSFRLGNEQNSWMQLKAQKTKLLSLE